MQGRQRQITLLRTHWLLDNAKACLQVGIPSDKDQYVHRVGRTARAGKVGQAVLLLQDFESYFLRKLQGLPVTRVEAASPQVRPRHRPAGLAAI